MHRCLYVVFGIKGWKFIPYFFLLLNLAVTIALVFYYMVSVNSRGIKCTNFWGKLHLVEWSTIRGARFYSEFWTAALKFILVSSTKFSQDLWLPLFLNDMSHFEQL